MHTLIQEMTKKLFERVTIVCSPQHFAWLMPEIIRKIHKFHFSETQFFGGSEIVGSIRQL